MGQGVRSLVLQCKCLVKWDEGPDPLSQERWRQMKYNRETRQVQCNQRVIKYELTRKPVKNINLRIKPDGKIHVSANNKVAVEYIDDLIKEKQDYIIRNLDKFERNKRQLETYKREYISGEKFNILGKSLILKVIQDQEEGVTSEGKYIHLKVKDEKNFKRKEKLMGRWFKKLQMDTFDQICKETYQVFKKYGLDYPEIKIRYMTSRWGSCRPHKNSITLNSRLIEKPISCIEYVVLHEFAHFVHPNHSKMFYDFLSQLMPDWKERKELLK